MRDIIEREVVRLNGGDVIVRELTEAQKAEYRSLKPGIYQMADRIRSVKVDDGVVEIL